MINKFCKTPLYMCSTTLVDVAMGRKPADLVIKNARLINVCTREILDGMSVAPLPAGALQWWEIVRTAWAKTRLSSTPPANIWLRRLWTDTFTSNRPC